MQVQRALPARLAALGVATACVLGVAAAPASAAPAVSELMVVKRVDAASHTLMGEVSTGTNDAQPRRRTIEGETSDYLVVTLKDALVTN